MASELLKNRALIQKLKEPDVPVINFDLANSALDYNIESIEEDILPKEKPQELFEERDRLRIESLEQSLQESKPFLMDESVDFIERENFAIKGLTDQQLLDLGFDKSNLQRQKETYKKLAEIFQQADIDDELEYLFQPSKNNPKGKIEGTLKNVFNKLPEDEKGLKYIANLLGEDVEFVLDIIDDKKILEEMSRTERMQKKKKLKSERLNKDFAKVEKWMLKNASKYSDPEKFKKATVNRFGKKNAAIKAMTSGGGNFFSTEFNNNILGYKGTSDFAKINKSIGDNIFRTTIYNFNPNVRNAITNEFKFILSGGPAQVKAEARSRIKQSKLFKQFGLTNAIRGPISRLIYKEVGEELYKNLQTFRFPRVGTINLIKYLESVVDPKYKSQFKQARIAIEAAGKNEFKKAKEILGRTDKIMLDHKIPSSFIDAGYADPIEYIKVTPATENFNVKIKSKQYDIPVMKLLKKFEKASTPEAKQVIYNTILEKHNNFSKKYGGYLDNVKPKLADGKIQFSSSAAPVTKKTKFVEEFVKAGLQTGQLSQAEANKLLGQKKLTAFEELKSRTGAGFDPILATKAGFEEFIKPGAKIATRGAATLADLAISAGPGAKGLGLGLLLEADPIITGMSQGKTFGQTARDTFIGSAIDAIPGVNLGSLNEDLLKLANTDEQRNNIRNLIDYQNDADKFKKRFENYKYLEDNPFEAEGVDLVAMEKGLLNEYVDLQLRKPKVINQDTFNTVKELATKEAINRKENLEGVQGLIFGERMAKDPNFLDKQIDQITRASVGEIGATDDYTDAYKFLPQQELLPEELDERFDMEGGIMAADGGRIGFADGPMDPKRRLFLKLMGGIMSLPFIPKFMKKSEVVKPIVKVAGSSTRMPEWFPTMINKVMFGGTGKKVDADLMIYEPEELPGITIGRYDDGRVFVEGTNEYGKKYQIEYEPPGFELLDEKTGKAVKTKGEFIAQEEVPVNIDRDGNADFDVEVLTDLDQILGPDTRAMEEFATGRKVKDMKSGEFAVGKAEADADVARDLDDFYED